MNEDKIADSFVDRLFQKYPLVFKTSEDRWLWDIPEGWIPLVDNLFAEINLILEESYSKVPPTEENPGFSVFQIKEKFAGLRVYFMFTSEDKEAYQKICELVDRAEDKSYEICQLSGQPGSVSVRNHHYMTLSEEMRTKHDYKEIPNKKL